MRSFFWRCLAALVAICNVAAPAGGAEAPWSAIFPGAGGEIVSAAFVVGDGRHVATVALSGAKVEGGRLRLEGRELPAEIFLDPVSRLVIFRMTGPPGKALPLMAIAPVRPGMPVHSGGGAIGKTTGWIKRVEGKFLPLSLLTIDYAIAAPMPGTPLLDAAGAVLGVAHQKTGPRNGYALPVEVVKRVLDDVQRGGRVSRAWIGLKLLPEASIPQVTRVQQGSPSADAGIKAGDVLLEVGPRRLSDYADAVNAFYFLRPGAPTSLRLKRGDQEIAVTVTPVERGSE